MILDERITYIESKNKNHHEKHVIVEDDPPSVPESNLPNITNESTDDNNLFLETIEPITTHKPLAKITLFIDYKLKKDFISLIESGANLNFIQEGLIMSRYFKKSTYSLRNASGHNGY